MVSRRWELPAEPGPEVYAVRTDLGTTYVRVEDGNRRAWESLPGDGARGGDRMLWSELLYFGLTDVTEEFTA